MMTSWKQDIVLIKRNIENVFATVIAEFSRSNIIDCAISCCSRDDCQYTGMRNETSCVLLSTGDFYNTISLSGIYEVSVRNFWVSIKQQI